MRSEIQINRFFWWVAFAAALPATVHAEGLIGQASVIDGDTIEIHGTRIRLWGIDAPESTQLCRNADSDLYPCGRVAANALAALLWGAKRPIRCEPVDHDQYGRTVAVCYLGTPGPDVAHWLVSNGHALDWPRYSKGKYAPPQLEAQKADRGMWSGSFVIPWEFRVCMRSGGRLSGCSDDASARP
jgi:endonuclease YncB( thermonuclease family)